MIPRLELHRKADGGPLNAVVTPFFLGGVLVEPFHKRRVHLNWSPDMLLSDRWCGLAAVILAVLPTWQAAEAVEPVVTEIAIYPAKASRFPLEYRLAPRISDQAPGVAAPHYVQALLALQESKADGETLQKMQYQWLSMPLDELPQEEVAEALAQVDSVFQCLDQAARRSRYGMESPLGDYERTLQTFTTRAQAFGIMSRLIELRFRYKLLQEDYQGAIHSLQSGYIMAQHCAEQPTAFNALVGFTLTDAMNDRLMEMVQLPDVPTLYWTLAALPAPRVDLQPVFDFESSAFESLLPELGRARAGSATPDKWRAFLVKTVVSPPWWEAHQHLPDPEIPTGVEKGIDAVLGKVRPAARRVLKAAGVSDAELERMSPGEVAVRALDENHRTQCRELGKLSHIPYWQAKVGIEQAVDETRRLFKEAGLPEEGIRALPSYGLTHIHREVAQSKRLSAGMRCVEAIRLYAARHDGKLPERLEDITEVPIPVNPMTGVPFPYRVEGRRVILDLDGASYNRQWRIRLADE